MDFDRSVNKLKKEQEKRREEARKKAERERKAQEEAKKQQLLIQEAVERRRREALEKEEADRLAGEEEKRITAGITYSKELLALDVSGEGDRITLPPSALEELTKQDALAQGLMLFQLTLVDENNQEIHPLRQTHAGVLEFSAEEGTVGLPLKIQRSLGAAPSPSTTTDTSTPTNTHTPAQVLGQQIRIKYIRLEKGTYAKFQPRTVGLSQVPDLKPMLEMNLQNHATLSEGDLLQVWYRGKCFDLRVVELLPSKAVTVIDTDIEVDLEVPEEQQRREAQEALGGGGESKGEGRGRSGSVGGITGTTGRGGMGGGVSPSPSPSPSPMPGKTLGASGSGVGGMGGGGKTAAEEEKGEKGVDTTETEEEKKRREALLSKLPAEPPATGPGSEMGMNILVRKPDGSVASRRFAKTEPFRILFDFVDASSSIGGGGDGSSYRLVTRFPRRVFTLAETVGKTFEEALGGGKQETLMYEAC